MRIILYTLILLLLSLSLKPCVDGVKAMPSVQETVAASDMHQGDENKQADECTPFCACHCCHTHFQVQKAEPAEYASSPYQLQKGDFYNSNFLLSPSYSIWQPPKVA